MSGKSQSEIYGHSYQLPLVVGIIGQGYLDGQRARAIEVEIAERGNALELQT